MSESPERLESLKIIRKLIPSLLDSCWLERILIGDSEEAHNVNGLTLTAFKNINGRTARYSVMVTDQFIRDVYSLRPALIYKFNKGFRSFE